MVCVKGGLIVDERRRGLVLILVDSNSPSSYPQLSVHTTGIIMPKCTMSCMPRLRVYLYRGIQVSEEGYSALGQEDPVRLFEIIENRTRNRTRTHNLIRITLPAGIGAVNATAIAIAVTVEDTVQHIHPPTPRRARP